MKIKSDIDYGKITKRLKSIYLKNCNAYNMEYYKDKTAIKIVISPKRSYYRSDGLRDTMLPHLYCKIKQKNGKCYMHYRFGLNIIQDTLFRAITIFAYFIILSLLLIFSVQGNLINIIKVSAFFLAISGFNYYVKGCNSEEKRDMRNMVIGLFEDK